MSPNEGRPRSLRSFFSFELAECFLFSFFFLGACLQAKNRVMVCSLDQLNGIIKDTFAETGKTRIIKMSTFSLPLPRPTLSISIQNVSCPTQVTFFFCMFLVRVTQGNLGSQGLQEKLLRSPFITRLKFKLMKHC